MNEIFLKILKKKKKKIVNVYTIMEAKEMNVNMQRFSFSGYNAFVLEKEE